MSAQDWLRWIAILVLLIGAIFFLFRSVAVKEKNPNELFTYMVLTTVLNIFFIYKLCFDSSEIKRDWIDYEKNNLGDVNFLSTLTFWLAIVGIFGCVLVLVLVFMTTLPLRDGIYEDIFW